MSKVVGAKDFRKLDAKALAEVRASTRSFIAEATAKARVEPGSFCRYVLRDERTGRPITLAPTHWRWHDMLDAHSRLVLWAHVDSGKTSQISVGRALFEIGRNPNIRVVIVSKTNDLAMKIVRTLGQYVRESAELKRVFPALRPSDDPAMPWTSHKLTVDRAVRAKDPTVQASGIYGNIHGARIDLLILDDIIDHTNTRTQAPRDHLWDWMRSTLFGRLTEEARVWALGNAWHPDDVLHRLEREPRFLGYRFPVVDAHGKLSWPEHWNRTRIDNARADMGPLEFSRALLCQARDDETARFKREHVEGCVARGMGRRLVDNSIELVEDLALEEEDQARREQLSEVAAYLRLGKPRDIANLGIRVYHGVDLAVQKHDAADETCFFSIAAFPNGDRRVLSIDAGRWDAPEILKKFRKIYSRFGGIFVVENVAAQDYLVQIMNSETAIPIIPFTTGRQKAHPEYGVESLAAEFAARKWIIPSGKTGKERAKPVDAWLSGLVGYDPAAHTSDYVMACWFAREGARMEEGRALGSAVGVRVFGADDDDDD